nr:putative ribonuclease H-like domain-containing protein [Tanacetum cinerariifolium]
MIALAGASVVAVAFYPYLNMVEGGHGLEDLCFHEKFATMDYLAQSLTCYEFYLASFLQGWHYVLLIIFPKDGRGFILNPQKNPQTNENCYRLAGLVDSVVGSLKWDFSIVNRQPKDWECGYYVMKWMHDFVLKYQNDNFPNTVPWNNERPLDTKELNTIIGAWTPWPIKGVLSFLVILLLHFISLLSFLITKEFGDSYKAPLEETGKGPANESSARKKGRTVAITTEDMQKRRNDVKARTTLLLALPDEHQLRFSKDDLDTMSPYDVYNYLKVYEPEVQKKSESNSQNMAFISSSNTSSGKGEVHTASVPTASTQVSTASIDVAASYMDNEEENHALVADNEVLTEFTLMAKSSSSSDNEGLGYSAIPPPPAQIYSPPKKDLSWIGLPEFVDDTVTDYRRPTPSIDASKCNKSELQSSNFSVFEHGESTGSIMSKAMIKFVKKANCHRVIKINNTENARKSIVKYAEMYRNISKVDESMLWHRRLGHLNFKTMNKLVRNNLVEGLPSKCFENDHTCVACLKGKQHKASCKTKTKDETSSILRNFITEIENLKDLKVKIIRCDNGGEFKNQEMNEFCTKKCIRREFSNARTPQQNKVAKRRNRTLIEAARTMLADAKFPVTF